MSTPRHQDVQEAPRWLKDRMEEIKRLPPPTLEEVREQLAASARLQLEEDLIS